MTSVSNGENSERVDSSRSPGVVPQAPLKRSRFLVGFLFVWAVAGMVRTALMLGATRTDGTIDILSVVVYVLALVFILLAREIGHAYGARRYGVVIDGPFFVPGMLRPYPVAQTWGSIVRLRTLPAPRRAALAVAAYGVGACMAAALPVLVVGLVLSQVVVVDPTSDVVFFDESPLFSAVARLVVGVRPPGTDILMNALMLAAWSGLNILSMHLLPLPNLDGGFVAAALFGRHARKVAWVSIGLLAIYEAVFSPVGLVVLVVWSIVGFWRAPTFAEERDIGRRGFLLGIVILLLFFGLQPFTLGLE